MRIRRREFLAGSAALWPRVGRPEEKNPIGLVQSGHPRLPRPAEPEDVLDYERVRDMVWQAIAYAGGMDGRIGAGAWVVLKPNIGRLRPQEGYRTGDTTDVRVIRAVLEYVALKTRAGRITIAEGGSYRGLRDAATDNVVSQNGARVDSMSYSWPEQEFPGGGGTLRAALEKIAAKSQDKRFDYVNLNYDGVRDASGKLQRIVVPGSSTSAGAFGARPDYFVTNTVRNCDVLISVPVLKCHMQCGITAALKNYVGTAPREAYAYPGIFWNANLHREHQVEDRIDGFIADLAAFHPPDFVVADGIRGLQSQEHDNGARDQMIRSNLVLASGDPVAADALAAYLLGFQPSDIEYLHMAQQRDMGSLDLAASEVRGDDPGRLRARWGKPQGWHGRGNRSWLVTANPEQPLGQWFAYRACTDTLALARATGATVPAECGYGAAARLLADGHRKAHLWMGVSGRATVTLNGEAVMQAEGLTRYRVGQFQSPVELRPGENLLRFRVHPAGGPARLSALLVGPRNDGDTVEGIRWI